MNIVTEFEKLFDYLIKKRSELRDLDVKDVVMAKAILDIHRTRSLKRFTMAPLFSLRQIHLLDRDNALRATEARARTLADHKADLLRTRRITREVLAQHLPSVSWIKVVQENADSFLAFEGNGRVAAMQMVFKPSDAVSVEVEQYLFKNPRKVLRRLNRVRRMNGLLDECPPGDE